MTIKQRFFHWKYLLDLGANFSNFVNSLILLALASDKWKSAVHINNTKLLVALGFGATISGMMFLGKILDHLKYSQGMNTAANERNDQWQMMEALINRTNNFFDKLENK